MRRHQILQSSGMTPMYPPGTPDPQSILVVLPTWVGDFVMATPALRAIRERFPGSRITFLMEANLLELARGGAWMDECVAWPGRGKRTVIAGEYRALIANFRRRRFDAVILLSNSFRSALLARLIGARRRIGYDRDGRGWLLTDRVLVPNRRGASNGRVRSAIPSLATTAVVQLGTQIPGRKAKYSPYPLVEYYADLVEAIGCRRPGDILELFTTAECEASIERRMEKERHEGTEARRHEGAARQDGAATKPDVSTLPRPLPGREGGGATKPMPLEKRAEIAEPATNTKWGGGAPIVALSPGAKFGASKCWAPQRFAAAADRLIEEFGATVFITCGPGEKPIAKAIAEAMTRRGRVLADPLLTLGELKSLIRRCDLLIANDAGPRHIAKAFGVPVVTVFGPTHPDWTATNYPRERVVRVDIDCGPCQQRVCPLGHHQCMELVSVEMVIAAAKELLEVRAADQRS